MHKREQQVETDAGEKAVESTFVPSPLHEVKPRELVYIRARYRAQEHEEGR